MQGRVWISMLCIERAEIGLTDVAESIHLFFPGILLLKLQNHIQGQFICNARKRDGL